MKPLIRLSASSCPEEPPACGLIIEAVEQYRQSPQSFRLDDFLARYEAPDYELGEAFAEELERAIRLEDLFAQFRNEKAAERGARPEEERQAP